MGTRLATGEVIQLQQAAIRSRSHFSGAGHRPACQAGGFKATEARGKSVSLQCSFPTATLARASAGSGEPKKIRLRLFRLGASNRIPIPRLLSLSILISNIINFLLQSRELLHDRIHIAVNSLSLNADRSSHCFNHDGQPCEALDSCSRFLNSSITQGKA